MVKEKFCLKKEKGPAVPDKSLLVWKNILIPDYPK
jgi:hypothetical protein